MLIWGWELGSEEAVAAMAGRVWFMYSKTKENAPKLRQLCANACGVPEITSEQNTSTQKLHNFHFS